MRPLLSACVLAFALSGCNSSTSEPTVTPTIVAHVLPTATVFPTSITTATPISISQPYRTFVLSLCRAFHARDVNALRGDLSYYQYNSGLRYGTLGDGEGQNGDPDLFSAWLAGTNVRCVAYTPDREGHGTLLTSGWHQSGGSALIDLDTFNGPWKINDFTFGPDAALRRVMGASAAPSTLQG